MSMTDAEKLFFAGGAHARAAHAIATAAQANVHMAVPFYLLLGFAVETVLKAAYMHHGGEMKKAKQEIGHDLPKALVAAEELGFVPQNQQIKWLVDTMADVHQNHTFRYLTGEGELCVAQEDASLRIVDDLIAQVGELLYPQHDREFWLERLVKFDSRWAEKSE
jgi:hypothetical protein